MLKVLAFLTKRKGLETQELIDYYENRHVPFVLSLVSATPLVYKRNYLVRGDEFNREDEATSSPSWCSPTEPGSSSGSRNSRSRRSQRTKNGSSIDRGRRRMS